VTMREAPTNPFLADSAYPIGHGTSAQQDSTLAAGPTGPGRVLTDGDLQYEFLGPIQMGMAISGPYADGSRTIWNNGSERITKLDHDTFEVVAAYEVPGRAQTPEHEIEEAFARLDGPDETVAMETAMDLSVRFLTGLSGVYFAMDLDNTLFLAYEREVAAFSDDRDDPRSPIRESARWAAPPEITGSFVGVNMTYDGWLVTTTDTGWIVCLRRDLSDHRAIQIRGAEVAEEFNARRLAEGRNGYGWVRTSVCVDDDGGIYVSSVDHSHKVIWRDEALSIDEADGAWTAQYRNGAGFGSGTTPSLMGFGDEDRFLVIGDGDAVVNITLLWRDEIPDDWETLPGAPSRRIAGIGRADMGDRSALDIQTEQSITVCGYGAMTVNNEPADVPEGFPDSAKRMLVFWLGNNPRFTPKGMHKYEWDPAERTFAEAWVCSTVASCNSVPYVSQGSDLVYTVGARDGSWTLEALRWSTGEEAFHHVLGGSRYNTLGAGIILDQAGRLTFGTSFGKVRILDEPG